LQLKKITPKNKQRNITVKPWNSKTTLNLKSTIHGIPKHRCYGGFEGGRLEVDSASEVATIGARFRGGE
jgi:hypothetical protein